MSIPFYDMIAFGSLIALAIYWRKKPDYHRRLVFIASCGLMDAAVGRFAFIFDNSLFFPVLDCLILLGVGRDLVVDGRVQQGVPICAARVDRRPEYCGVSVAGEPCVVAGDDAGDFGLSRLGYPLIEFITEDLERTEGRHPICQSAKQATLPELLPVWCVVFLRSSADKWARVRGRRIQSLSIQVTLLGVRMICGLLLFSSVLFASNK